MGNSDTGNPFLFRDSRLGGTPFTIAGGGAQVNASGNFQTAAV